MKKLISTTLISLAVVCSLVSCAPANEPKETTTTTVETIIEEIEKEYYLTDILDEYSEFEFLDDYVDENEIGFTIEYQQKIVGNTYLLNLFDFDICELNGNIILTTDDLWWYDPVIMISISKEQCEKIISTAKSGDSLAVEIHITDVIPVPITYSADCEYSYDYIEISEDGDEAEYMQIINDDIYAYIDVSSHDSSILKASCLEVYTLNDVLKYIN